MIPQKTIEELLNKHSILEKDLSSGKIDKKIFAEKSKEYSDLNSIVEDAKKYLSFEKDNLGDAFDIELKKYLDEMNPTEIPDNLTSFYYTNIIKEYNVL